MSRIFALPEVVGALQKVGGEALPMRPSEFARFVRAERIKWAEVVKSAGVYEASFAFTVFLKASRDKLA